ncbi:MAG: 4-alpha-glucanotransferase [Acutalibacteraceae bacterium]|nr:4-alpha-glucanotransferase [Acutalibacteraceae bacterium]
MERSSGILMPIFSLPSKYGIGTLGKEAYHFADFLEKSRQKYWQVLPLGPTGYGNSPYASFSSFAGNAYLIDLDLLIEDGLLERDYVESFDWGDDPETIDYGKIEKNRREVLRKAFENGFQRDRSEVDAFVADNFWAEDYAMFRALRDHFDESLWINWEEPIRLRRPEAVEQYKRLLRTEIDYYLYIQFLFSKQWNAFRDYVHSCGIKIIGDLPIYVPMDSADTWREPQFFQLDRENIPTCVAGVPPDYFAKDGQLWGNPLYDWDAMQRDGYGWWIRRVEGASKKYDVIRIDHFRAFESYWAVPYGETTAKNGQWRKGPGMDLVKVLRDWFYNLDFIAEDLGDLTPDVHRLVEDSGFPGMNVLEFAFSPDASSKYLPHYNSENSVCYVGTHDNDTARGWLEDEEVDAANKLFASKYLGLNDQEDRSVGMIRGGMVSPAWLFVAQMQDWLGLGSEARMNIPGTATGNWRWRMLPGKDSEALAKEIAEYTRMFGRDR